jgi:hypothetical protein
MDGSTESSSSFSSASIFTAGLLTEVRLRGKDPLAGVSLRVRMRQDVEQVAPLDVEDDVFEPDVLNKTTRSTVRPGVPSLDLQKRADGDPSDAISK